MLIRFFHDEDACRREIQLYESGVLEDVAVPLLSASEAVTRNSAGGEVLYTPGYLVTETELSLKEVLATQPLTTPECVEIWLEAATLVHTLRSKGYHYGHVTTGNLQWMVASEGWRL